jgi:hypothetical protein
MKLICRVNWAKVVISTAFAFLATTICSLILPLFNYPLFTAPSAKHTITSLAQKKQHFSTVFAPIIMMLLVINGAGGKFQKRVSAR